MSAVVVDTSALVAILREEPAARRLLVALATADTRLMSAACLLEAEIVATQRGGPALVARLDWLLSELRLEVADVTAAQVAIARLAFREFGKGRHPASLNFGDCFSYALARARGEPLLFVGDDFARTDVEVAAY